ncbi:hypothetical protein RA2_02927 [Roseovarius sp. A-2]|uniref:DUF1028 domain-containing protein n=1 Tax=Roseovarius sp. A-2 TaxID=1570360 RepID=UPI0009B51FDE|nr:DUF1028 domain-containing protein [Roseovarius sp. A-2]GAW35859.1 hypothetical protein RA2_02927 [Roseovarius sp. A-2]
MTFSILAHDPETGAFGGAAATGSLCVGGWVLRGHARSGLSASQGAAPSTLWGEDVLDLMEAGQPAQAAVDTVTRRDAGRGFRQLSALDSRGRVAAFSGADNTPAIAERLFPGGVAAGNMLASGDVVDRLVEGYLSGTGSLAERLLAALRTANAAGGDSRGLMSAALLVVSADHAPLSLRIDLGDAPLDDLARLLHRASSGDYADWARQVPTQTAPERILD